MPSILMYPLTFQKKERWTTLTIALSCLFIPLPADSYPLGRGDERNHAKTKHILLHQDAERIPHNPLSALLLFSSYSLASFPVVCPNEKTLHMKV